MLVTHEVRQNDPELDEIQLRQSVFNNLVVCIASTKIVAVIYAIMLLLLMLIDNIGSGTAFLQVLIGMTIPVQIANSAILFYGLRNENARCFGIGIWICLAMAVYNTTLGIVGFVYFVRYGQNFVHFIIAALFSFLILSLCVVLCHDIPVLYTMKKSLEGDIDFFMECSRPELPTIRKNQGSVQSVPTKRPSK